MGNTGDGPKANDCTEEAVNDINISNSCIIMESELLKKEEDVQTSKTCLLCEIEFPFSEYYTHYDKCRSKHTIRAIDIRRDKTYIFGGKMYTISAVERIGKRLPGGMPISVIVRLYCKDDQTSIRFAFRHDERFRIDANNCIIIV
jgi:dissimilatory sulfite reductase (desulfoviridin) alpha/beta subunit